MGKITGFMDYERVEEGYKPVPERLKNYREFVIGLDDTQAKPQAARCMDCGTPFCISGCPVNNIIPDFNDLVYSGDSRIGGLLRYGIPDFKMEKSHIDRRVAQIDRKSVV